MKYENKEWRIAEVLSLYENNKINLSPPYQRNDIWSLPAKKRLIESIKLGYPLPSFFFHKKDDNNYDIVDGQQRIRTFLGYMKGAFPDFNKNFFNLNNDGQILDFKISIVTVETEEGDSIEDFYYRVNNYGSKLNRQEIIKAQYSDTFFLEIVEELSTNEDFSSLALFSTSAANRMMDIEFISELIAQLKFGITDKKKHSEKLYEIISTKEEAADLRIKFLDIVSRIQKFNKIFPINQTRYKQRNDFYTLFGFIYQVLSLESSTLEYFYRILVAIGGDISPSNLDCAPLQNYAFNCVSQSNSADARSERLKFFQEVLLNESTDLNETQEEILDFYKIDQEPYEIQGYVTLNAEELEKVKSI